MDNATAQNWIIVASKEHVKAGVEGGFAQACHGKANPLRKMKAGDNVIYYSGKKFFNKPEKCQEFTAIGRVKNDNVYAFQMSEDFCPHRLDVEFFECRDISILPLIEDLEFIQNKQKWGYPFRWGVLKINTHDFSLISKRMLNGTEN